MKLRTYKIYWTEHYPSKVEASKDIRAANIDELIDILREVMVDKGFDRFTVVNPEGINMSNSGKELRWIAKRGEIHD